MRKSFKEKAKEILELHNCTLVKMITECSVLWENKYGYQSCDDIFVLNNMGERAWDYWSNYNPV